MFLTAFLGRVTRHFRHEALRNIRKKGGRWQWLKWLIHFLAQLWFRPCPPKKVGGYRPISEGVRTSGFIATAKEWEVDELRQDEGRNQDELFFYGGHSSGWQVSVAWIRGSAAIFLRQPSGRSFVLPRYPDGRCPDGIPPSLKFICISPFRKWRISYNGWLREYSEKSSSPLVHVKFSFTFNPNALLYSVPMDSTPEMAADCLSLQPFSTPTSHRMMESMERFQQCGMLLGTVKLAEDSPVELSLWGLRIRDSTRYEVDQLKGSVEFFGILPSGLNILAGATSLEPDVPHLQHGCINFPNRTRQLLEASNVVVGSPVNDVSVWAENCHQTWLLKPVAEFSLLHGPRCEMVTTLSFATVSHCDKTGHGFVLTTERNKQGSPVPEIPSRVIKETKLSSVPSLPFVVTFEEPACRCLDLTGGKGSSLGMLHQLAAQNPGKFTVPAGLVVTTPSYRRHLEHHPHLVTLVGGFHFIEFGDIQKLKKHCQMVAEAVEKTDIKGELKKTISDVIKSKFGDNSRLAIRSSALGEDSEDTSSAGQMTTVLGVRGLDKVLEAIVKCWASQFQLIAVQYKLQHGMPLDPGMAVVVQEMVPAEVAGVTFTRDPVTGDPGTVTITANYGLGESVVSAACEPDTVKIARGTSLVVSSIDIGSKAFRSRMDESEGTLEETLTEEESQNCCLSEAQILKLGQLAIEVEDAFNSPRDLEWAVVKDDIYLLQARAITTLHQESDFDIVHELDTGLAAETEFLIRANIGEVMPGALTPLTHDVVMKGYNLAIQEEFLNMLKGRGPPIDPLTMSLIPYSSFQTFLNLLDWVLATVDKSKKLIHRSWELNFFGRLIDEHYIDAAVERNGVMPHPVVSPVYCHLDSYVRDYRGLKLVKSVRVIDANKFSTAKALYEEITDNVYDSFKNIIYHRELTELSTIFSVLIIENLVSHYNGNIEAIMRDIAILLSNSQNLESADVPSALQNLAVEIIRSERREEFVGLDVKAATKLLKEDNGHLGQVFRKFVTRHAHRSFKEFDFATRTWGENPESLVQSLQVMARNMKMAETSTKKQLSAWEAIGAIQYKPPFLQKLKLWYLVKCARRSVMLREKGKSWLVKGIDLFRKPFRRLGQLLHQEGKLPDPDLILYLTYNEVAQLVQTHVPYIVNKVRQRHRLFKKMDKCIFPEITSGVPRPINVEVPKFDGISSNEMTGIIMSQGFAEGTARVIVDFEEVDKIQHGDILITYGTDVGWSPYFPLLSGVVTELGGLMSHGAVVAREYGLPCLAGVQGATSVFNSGDTVVLDAFKGILKKIDPA